MAKLNVGLIFNNSKYGEYKVIRDEGFDNVTIEFISTGHLVKVYRDQVRRNSVRNPFHPVICGVGFMGIGEFKSRYSGTPCKIYSRWSDMLRRCYDKDSKFYYLYGGKGIKVVKEWHNFQNFALWFSTKILDMGLDPYVSDFHLDKDLIDKDAKIYSPGTCSLVPAEDNISEARRGKGKTASFIHKDGRTELGVNVADFAKRNKLWPNQVYRLVKGTIPITGGWKLLI